MAGNRYAINAAAELLLIDEARSWNDRKGDFKYI